MARRSEEPIHLVDICRLIDTPDHSHACYHVRRAEKAGLIRKIGWTGGWVARVTTTITRRRS